MPRMQWSRWARVASRLLLGLLLVRGAFGAEPHFESVGADVIPRGVVPSMAQDRAGFLWIATGDGLVRYDGYSFRAQSLVDLPAAERNLGWIRAMLATPDGRLWIGTETRGLAVYEPSTGRIELLEPRAIHQPQPTIRALAQDRQGGIWVGSIGGALRRYDPQHRSWRDLGLPDPRVESLLVDQQGRLWIGSWQGLLRLDAGAAAPQPVLQELLAGRRITALHLGRDGRLWIGTQHGDLVVHDLRSGEARLLGTAADTQIASAEAVSSITELPDGQIWVGRSSGIDLIDSEDGRLLHKVRPEPGRDGALRSRQVTQLLLDRAGWLWVSGFGLGLQRHNPGNKAIAVELPGEPARSGKESLDVRQVLPLRNGEVWLASEQGGILALDAQLRYQGGLEVRPRRGKGQPQAWAMAEARDGTVWIGAGAELLQYSPRRQLLRSLVHGGGMTRRLVVSREGTVWIGTEDGLYRLRPGADRVERLRLADGRALSGEMHAITQAPDGSMWFGAMPGLYRLGSDGQTLELVRTAPDAGLGNPVVLGILFDRAGRLWVDTAVTGLHLAQDWKAPELRFARISERHGEIGRPFGANLMEDGQGRIWTHMYVYDPASDRLDALRPADGVNFGTGWFQSFGQHPDGRMFFGGSRGLLVVRPELFRPSADQPPVVVSELRIDGQPRLAGDLRQGLRLEPGQRGFSLEFATLDFSEPARLRYAYRLEGYDSDWITTGADFRVVSYGNLPPGRYLLKLRGSNRSGLWSPHELHIPVEVLPAWWQRWWARALAALLAAAALLGLVQLRTRQLRQHQLVLEHKVRERTAALEEASLSDPLTGLRNRRFLAQQIAADVSICQRRYQGWSAQQPAPVDADLLFFLIDVDHFKAINDRHGHAAGDEVIRQMGERLKPVFRDGDYLIRWGGEEFLVVARGSDRRHAAEISERVRQAVADAPFRLPGGQTLSVRCSTGFAAFPLIPSQPFALGWDETINLADAALYDAKARGRNAWTGVLQAQAALAHRPSAQEWLATGELELVRSDG